MSIHNINEALGYWFAERFPGPWRLTIRTDGPTDGYVVAVADTRTRGESLKYARRLVPYDPDQQRLIEALADAARDCVLDMVPSLPTAPDAPVTNGTYR